MSNPLPNFSLGSLDFQDRFLSASQQPLDSQINSQIDSQPLVPDLSIFNSGIQDKEVKLASGKKLTLKKKKAKHTQNISIKDSSREDYGFSINELFAKLEVQRLKEIADKRKKDESIPTKSSYLSKSKKKNPNNTLWAEKWRPKTFLDFVGNELTNRKILRWLKQWDKVVFDKNLKPITENDNDAANIKYVDVFGRPNRKVLLLNGPPGIGKTTIAHVIAKQMGYEVMEINASDERAGQRVKDKITNSISSITFSGKPVCLIADEVDGGSESGFIKVLLDLITQDQRNLWKYSKMQSSKFWSENGGANKKKFLMRPIIAICNDLYAPALEKLRVNAEIITFNQIDESSLRDRLKFICANEKVRFTNQQLKEIITLTNFDIRSCLNILQFSGDDSINKGQKDMQTSWYSIVSQLFKKDPRLSKRQQFKNLQHLINTHHSNFEKIINGCFQTYTDVHYQDISLSKPSLISDWLYFSDLVQRTQYDSSGVDLSHYSELTALQFFSQFSDVSNSNLKIKSDWEYFDKTRTNNSILKVIFTKLSTTLKTVFKMDDLVIDLLPSLDYIMIPEISKRSTNSLVKKDSTLKKVNNAVNAINSAGLLINKSKDENYNEIYRTFPDFTHITKFDPTSIKRQQVRQSQVFPTLVKELEHHKIMKRKIDSTKDSDDVIADVNDIDVLKTQYNQIAENERLAKRQKTQTDIKIWVRYHEGFSNAVRKKVRWDDLWS